MKYLMILLGAASVASMFAWGAFNYSWWVPFNHSPAAPDLRAFVMLLLHVGSFVVGVIGTGLALEK